MKNNFDAFKMAIAANYEEKKRGRFSDLLLDPTPANLKRLCVILNEEKLTSVDLSIFRHFFSLKTEIDISRQIKSFDTEKFKPLSSFLKSGTNLKDYGSANLVAILVDFKDRPYTKFLDSSFACLDNTKDLLVNKSENVHQDFLGEKLPKQLAKSSINFQHQLISLLSKSGILLIYFFSLLLFTAFVIKDTFDDKCMIWKGDHYEKVDCDENRVFGEMSYDNVVALNKEVLENFKKINVCDTTTFFINDRPMVWYSKQDGRCEFFSGNGIHPVTRKLLRPITKHMVEKHILKVHDKNK